METQLTSVMLCFLEKSRCWTKSKKEGRVS